MLQIIKFPNVLLTEKMPAFDFDNPIMDPLELEKQMLTAMYASDGIGLAANQVGIAARVFVMGYKDDPENGMAFFNPVIDKNTDDIDDMAEGCLSFPGIYVNIKRPGKIQVSYQSSSGEARTEILEGLNCRCFLHEFDHLEGITFQSRVSALKWAMAVKKSKPKRKFK